MISHSRSSSIHPALQQQQQQQPQATRIPHKLLVDVLLLPPSLAREHASHAVKPKPHLPTLRLFLSSNPSDTIKALLHAVTERVNEDEGGWGDVRGLGVFNREGYKAHGSEQVDRVFDRVDKVLVTVSSSAVNDVGPKAAADEEKTAMVDVHPASGEGGKTEAFETDQSSAHHTQLNGSAAASERQPARKKARISPPNQPVNPRTSPPVQPLPPPPSAPTPATPRSSAMPPPSHVPSRSASIAPSAQSSAVRRAASVMPSPSPRLTAVAANGTNGVASARGKKKDRSHLPLDVETEDEDEDDEADTDETEDKQQQAESQHHTQHDGKIEEKTNGVKAAKSKAAPASASREGKTDESKERTEQKEKLTEGDRRTSRVVEVEEEQLPATQQLQQSSQEDEDDDEALAATQVYSQSSQQSDDTTSVHDRDEGKDGAAEMEEEDWEDDKPHAEVKAAAAGDEHSSGLDDESDDEEMGDAGTSKAPSQPQPPPQKHQAATNGAAEQSDNDDDDDKEEEEQEEDEEEEEQVDGEKEPKKDEAKKESKQTATTTPHKQANGKSAQADSDSSADESSSDDEDDSESGSEVESEDESDAEGKTPVLQPEMVPFQRFRTLQGNNSFADKLNAPPQTLPPSAAAVVLPLSQSTNKPAVKAASAKPAANDDGSGSDSDSDSDSGEKEKSNNDSDSSDEEDSAAAAKQSAASRKLSLPNRAASHITPRRVGNAALAHMFDDDVISASQPASRDLPSSRQSVGIPTPPVRKGPPSPYVIMQGRTNKQHSRRATVGEAPGAGRTVEAKEAPKSVNGTAVKVAKKAEQGGNEKDTTSSGGTAQSKPRPTSPVKAKPVSDMEINGKVNKGNDKERPTSAVTASMEEKSESVSQGKMQSASKTQGGSTAQGKRDKLTKPTVATAVRSPSLPAVSSSAAPAANDAVLSPASASGSSLYQFSPPSVSSSTDSAADKANDNGTTHSSQATKATAPKKNAKPDATVTVATAILPPPPSASPTPAPRKAQRSDSSSSADMPDKTPDDKAEARRERARKAKAQSRAREKLKKEQAQAQEGKGKEKDNQKENKKGKTVTKKRKKVVESSDDDNSSSSD